jgi:hypothetical protein
MNAWKRMAWIVACGAGVAIMGVALSACESGDSESTLAQGSMVVAGGTDTTVASGILSSTGIVQAVVTLSGATTLPNMVVAVLVGATTGLSTGNGTLTVTQAGNAGATCPCTKQIARFGRTGL